MSPNVKVSKQKERIQYTTTYFMLKWKLQIDKIEDPAIQIKPVILKKLSITPK